MCREKMNSSLFILLFNVTAGGRKDIFVYYGAHVDSTAAVNAAKKEIQQRGWKNDGLIAEKELKKDDLVVAANFGRFGGLYACVFQLPAQNGGWCEGAYFAPVTANDNHDAQIEAQKAFRLPPNVAARFLTVERIPNEVIHEVCPPSHIEE